MPGLTVTVLIDAMERYGRNPGVLIVPVELCQVMSMASILDGVEQALVPIGDHTTSASTSIWDRMRFHRARVVSLAVVQDFAVVATKAYFSDEAAAETIGNSALLQAASISKPLTAMAVMRLVRERQLSLDDDVNEHLLSWKIPANRLLESRRVTPRLLLSHSAGTTVSGFQGYEPDQAIPSTHQILDGLPPANNDPIRIADLPGSAFRYSGGGYTILQQLLVDICKHPFRDLMREIVLDPLGMADSTFEQPLPDGLRERAVAGTLLSGEVPRGGWRIHPEMAAAGLWTTPADLARFVVELQLSWLGRPSRVLSREISALMLTPYRALPADIAPYLGSHCGLGMFIEWGGRSRSFSHSGGNVGYVAHMVGDFSGNGAVVMTSSEAMELVGEVLLAIARSFHWEFDLPGLPSVTPT